MNKFTFEVPCKDLETRFNDVPGQNFGTQPVTIRTTCSFTFPRGPLVAASGSFGNLPNRVVVGGVNMLVGGAALQDNLPRNNQITKRKAGDEASERHSTENKLQKLNEIKDTLKVLENNWTEKKDEIGRSYFYNRVTGQYRWDIPDELKSQNENNWTEKKDEIGRSYFYNRVSGQYRWDMPDELKSQNEKSHWVEQKDRNGTTYFYNHLIKQYSWEKPKELKPEAEQKCYWTKEKDKHGRIYFYNHRTKYFSWQKPYEMKSHSENADCFYVGTFHQQNKRTPAQKESNCAEVTGQHLDGRTNFYNQTCDLKSQPKVPSVQSQKERNYQALAALDDLDLVLNTEPFECPTCIKYVVSGEGVVLHECLHSFCKECLAAVIERSNQAAIKCPFENIEYSCESYIQDREVKSLVTSEMYATHVQRSVEFLCKTPHCPGRGFFKDYMNNFVCPECKRNNCLTCTAIHEGMTCEQFQKSVNLNCDNEKRAKENLQCAKGANCEEKIDNQAVLAALDEANLVPNSESFECPICFTNIDSGDGVILHDCLHNFCKECLTGVIQHSESAVVRCPFQNDEYACESHLQEREIKSIVTPEIYDKHLKRSIMLAESQAPDSFHCKTPDCPGWCLYEDDVNVFHCPVCSKTNCLTCAAIHQGRNCRQYQDYVAFNCDTNEEAKRTKKYLQDMLAKGEAMECPKCRIIIMKKNGCDALTCTMCHLPICWVTKGPRWGPKGIGDISGGCRCNYMGQRCHPKCNNCH